MQSPPPPRRTQADRRARTETRLLEAALRLIALSGSRGTSVADVANDAGYSRGIITHQFGGKEGLLRAAAQHAVMVVAEPDPSLAAFDWLQSFVSNYLIGSDPSKAATRAFLVMWSEAAAGEPVLRGLFRERDARFRSAIAHAIERGAEDGSIRRDINPEAYAYLLVGQLRGIGVQLILSEDDTARPSILAECVEMVRRHLRPDPPR